MPCLKKQMLDVFRKWDTDGNKTISKEEFSKILVAIGVSAADCEVLFEDADTNEDGNIDFEEFFEWLYRDAPEAVRLTCTQQGMRPRDGPVKNLMREVVWANEEEAQEALEKSNGDMDRAKEYLAERLDKEKHRIDFEIKHFQQKYPSFDPEELKKIVMDARGFREVAMEAIQKKFAAQEAQAQALKKAEAEKAAAEMAAAPKAKGKAKAKGR
eukprot:gnl/MRDRNA2_/MRDRNA2_102099_c0_seq1.p1 gnl/MRDRNA2_/MRDRNA2_102099_c0~~gnl/MRDRNA2_/MRDRNA2_102099_c0_seq1.p1  ORF type:complete len:213 (+),score=73.77 gnl/MRDRNA2_/MRDRNA2_102099_c0_seq1:126-764(+)